MCRRREGCFIILRQSHFFYRVRSHGIRGHEVCWKAGALFPICFVLISYCMIRGFFAACFTCKLLLTLFLARRFLSPWRCRRYVPPKRRFIQKPHGVISQKTAFLIPFFACSSAMKIEWRYSLIWKMTLSGLHAVISQTTRVFITNAERNSNPEQTFLLTLGSFGECKTCLQLKNGIFEDVTPCGSCKNRRFGGN
jgi:hypothetical protein